MAKFVRFKKSMFSPETINVNVEHIISVSDLAMGTFYKDNTPIKCESSEVVTLGQTFHIDMEDYNKLIKVIYQ